MKTKPNLRELATEAGDRRTATLPEGWMHGSMVSLRVADSWFFRIILFCLILPGSLVVSCFPAFAKQHEAQHPAQQSAPPRQQPQRAASPGPAQHQPNPGQHQPGPKPNQHLGEWLSTHQHQPLAEQQKALQMEPGFSKLPPEQQQRLASRLRELDNKTPEQRQRTIDRVEVWERLSPEQKRQVSNSTAQLRLLPPDRQQPLRRAFHDLRDVPPEQRHAILNSPQFQSQFTPQERGILGSLLTVEPYPSNRPNPTGSPALPIPTPAYR